MSSYLLKWNPKHWPQEKFDEYFDQFEQGKVLRWSCGNTKKIVAGDTFYLLKQGKGNKGIIGSGYIVSTPYVATHYQAELAEHCKTALYVDVRFDYLSHPKTAIPITRDELNSSKLSSSIWDAQGSGKSIPAEIESELTQIWLSRIELYDFVTPDEILETGILEGAKKIITVNAYERNPEARRRCIAKWGYNCFVCGFHFELYYGILGKKYIHVHHLKPIATIGEEYEIDPINDLRPVCPNCHAMLHKKTPPLSIEELNKVVMQYGSRA